MLARMIALILKHLRSSGHKPFELFSHFGFSQNKHPSLHHRSVQTNGSNKNKEECDV